MKKKIRVMIGEQTTIKTKPRFGTVTQKDSTRPLKPKPLKTRMIADSPTPSENMETDSYTGNLIKEPMIIFMIIGVISIVIAYIVGALI